MDKDSLQQSQVEALLNKRKKQDEAAKLKKEQVEELGKAVSRIFSSSDGQFLGKCWVKEMQLFNPNYGRDGMELVEAKGAKAFYLTYVRPFLDDKSIKEIEGN